MRERGSCGTNGLGQRNAAATGALVALLLLVLLVVLPGSKLSKLRTALLAKNAVLRELLTTGKNKNNKKKNKKSNKAGNRSPVSLP